MKIQSLAIIFVIIIMPIAILVSEYVQGQKSTLSNQISYDSKLISATYDAVKAFQINTVNSTTSDIAGSKIRDIEAASNAFFDSISNGFGLKGNKTDAIKMYVPALVFTLYDGYYIYSPYTNDLGAGNGVSASDYNGSVSVKPGSTYENGESIYGTKPYIYYTRRYKPNSTSDFVITYTLDNYITIQGTIGSKYVNTSGYLLNDVVVDGLTPSNYFINDSKYYKVNYDKLKTDNVYTKNVTYNGISIDNELLEEYLIDETGEINSNKPYRYKYAKVNGTKYYFDNAKNDVFYMLNNSRVYHAPSNMSKENCIDLIEHNTSAKQYYINAYVFTNWLTNNSVLKNLKSSDAVDYDSSEPNYKIFDANPIEAPNSNFNAERLATIRKSIEKNLSIAIANYNGYSTSTNEFLMPVLKEEEWTKIINNISVISFLQGLPIGGKVYNGYAIVENSKSQEVVAEDSIYLAIESGTGSGYYHKITDSGLTSMDTGNIKGYYNVDFERKTVANKKEDGSYDYVGFFYPQEKYGCYYCIVNQEKDAIGEKSMYEYVKELITTNPNLSKIYYTALGRERASSYKIMNDI